jgi:hypothetical protein
VNEIRETTSGREGDSRISEERVSRPDAAGKLREISRVVSKGSEDSSGEKRNKVESYSIDVPGTPEDGSLHLVERTTVTQRSSSPGEQVTERQVEKFNPGDLPPVAYLCWSATGCNRGLWGSRPRTQFECRTRAGVLK